LTYNRGLGHCLREGPRVCVIGEEGGNVAKASKGDQGWRSVESFPQEAKNSGGENRRKGTPSGGPRGPLIKNRRTRGKGGGEGAGARLGRGIVVLEIEGLLKWK